MKRPIFVAIIGYILGIIVGLYLNISIVPFCILIIAIHTSKIGIDIKNLIIDTDAEEKINEDGKIYVYLLLFNKINYLPIIQ